MTKSANTRPQGLEWVLLLATQSEMKEIELVAFQCEQAGGGGGRQWVPFHPNFVLQGLGFLCGQCALRSWKVKAEVLFNLVLEKLWTSRAIDQENPCPLLSSPLHCFLLPVSTRVSGRGRGEAMRVSILLLNMDLDYRELLSSNLHKHVFRVISSSTFQYPSPGQSPLKG